MSGTSSHYDTYYSDDYTSNESFYSDSDMESGESSYSGQRDSGTCYESMSSILRDDLHGLILRDHAVEDFVKNVYGGTEEDIKYIDSKIWSLDPNGLAKYNEAMTHGLREELYEPFKSIMDDLFATFIKDGHRLDIHLASPVARQLKNIVNPRKPHGLFFFGLHDDNTPITWSLSKAFLKIAITSEERRLRQITLDSHVLTSSEAISGTSPSTPEMGANIGGGHASAAASSAIETPAGTKRGATDILEGQRPSKRPKIRLMTTDESQAAGHALELMASTCRRWTSGLSIIDKDVWVHYYDRLGAIITKEFNFFDEPSTLALLALAIAKCDAAQAGLDPLLVPNFDTPVSRPLPSRKDAVLRLPHPKGQAVRFVNDIGKGLWSHFKITGDPLYVYLGVSGRGSHVLPGYLVKAAADVQAATEVAEDNGKDQETSSMKKTSFEDMVVKISWPTTKRPKLEAETLHALHQNIPWMKHHLPSVHCAMVLEREAINLPRQNLFHDMTTTFNLEQRHLTLLFTDRYQHLWEVPTLRDFISAYLDIVECHHAAMKVGKVLHRDISDRNLLCRWHSKAQRSVGILNDWDLASGVGEINSGANYRTGTGPFMAIDLLAKGPPAHLYRHDLESLFYVLVWAAVNYTFDKENPFASKPNGEILKWAGMHADAHEAKTLFLFDPVPVFKGIQPAFEPMRNSLYGLRDLFYKAHQNWVNLELKRQNLSKTSVAQTGGRAPKRNVDLTMCSDDEELPAFTSNPHPEPSAQILPGALIEEVDIDFETLGGCLTFENFLAALRQRPRPIPHKYQHLVLE